MKTLLLVLFALLQPLAAPEVKQADRVVQVRSVLFFAPSCPHCHEIMQDFLPPVLERYGHQLVILAINVETPEGLTVYRAVVSHFDLTPDRLGVPALIVDDRMLVGSGEIPADFPGLIDAGLAAGGIDWPRIAAVRAFMKDLTNLQESGLVIAQTVDSAFDADTAISLFPSNTRKAERTFAANFARDPIANSVAVLVAVFMTVMLIRSLAAVVRSGIVAEAAPRLIVPVLAIIGAGIAAYLAYIELSGDAAVCGPLGHCNEVQSSSYAQVLGVPVAFLGLSAYLCLAGGSLINRMRGGTAAMGTISWVVAFVGVLFSLYLTLLEPFVIGATCMWCLTSAVLITTILHLLTDPVHNAQQQSPAAG